MKDRIFQNFRMKLGNAVDGMGADHAEIRHAHLCVCDDRHAGNPVPVARIKIPKVRAEAAVDLAYDGINPGKPETKKILVPAFQRLRHDGVIRIGNGLCHRIPSGFP